MSGLRVEGLGFRVEGLGNFKVLPMTSANTTSWYSERLLTTKSDA